ncbi:flagellin [Sporosarcina sp. SG10008]|uniref:flagellin N-terminal helical domain-containing protein n=1 Tax=Sporosarcina sp. SG10008 TaxID=3373103 RepID=UPI0037DD4050
MRINHNIAALNTHRQLNSATTAQSKSMEKLASGLRINKAGDDAAGLAISEKMRGQIRGLDQASKNSQDGISMIATAEGALNETHDILQRMRELSNQSANGTATDADRTAMQDELNNLTSEINRIGNTTEFNTQKVLNGGIGSNDGAKIEKADSAKVTAAAVATAGTTGASLTVDNITFDLSGVKVRDTAQEATDAGLAKTAADQEKTDADAALVLAPTDQTVIDRVAAAEAGVTAAAAAVVVADANDLDTDFAAKEAVKELGNKTSGGTKLSELVDISTDGAGKLVFTAKSTGASSSIEFSADDAALGITKASDKGVGQPSTVERTGIEATTALGGTTAGNTVVKDSTFTVAVGSESAVTVTLKEGKTYDTGNADANVAKAASAELIKDLNAALQEAGLSDKVTASISKDNKVQFISETGKDIKLGEGTNTPLADIGVTVATDVVKNIGQVTGPGAQGTGFNTKFQIGANTGQSMSLQINDMRSAALGITGNSGQAGFTTSNSVTNGTSDIKAESALNISNKEDASKSIAVIDKAIASVSSERGKLGAVQNRLEHTINNLNTSSENLTAAESRIRDVDMAKEMMEQTKNSILSQAAQAMLAQSNQMPQGVLQLLR